MGVSAFRSTGSPHAPRTAPRSCRASNAGPAENGKVGRRKPASPRSLKVMPGRGRGGWRRSRTPLHSPSSRSGRCGPSASSAPSRPSRRPTRRRNTQDVRAARAADLRPGGRKVPRAGGRRGLGHPRSGFPPMGRGLTHCVGARCICGSRSAQGRSGSRMHRRIPSG